MKSNKHEVNRVVNYVKNATPDELIDDYGVELLETGEIYDSVDDRLYHTIVEWAESITAQDDEEFLYGSKNKWSEEDDY